MGQLMDIPLLFSFPGGWEWIVIVFVILLLFGAKRLPELARGLGKGIREFKGAVDGAKNDIENVGKEVESENDEKSCE